MQALISIETRSPTAIPPFLEKFLQNGLIQPCQSPCNTPILPVRDQIGNTALFKTFSRAWLSCSHLSYSFQPVHIPLPIPGYTQFYTMLDLKDAFCCILLYFDSTCIFSLSRKTQKPRKLSSILGQCYSRGFRIVPHLFGWSLARDLRDVKLANGSLLQYVDDLIASEDFHSFQEKTDQILNFLTTWGYKVFPSMAQISQTQIQYLGFLLNTGVRMLNPDWKLAIALLPVPCSKKELQGFLRIASFCKITIPNVGLIAKSLYEALRGGEKEQFHWDEACWQA